MGMAVGRKGGSLSEPNIVPLIDILLVLIIIFMVVTPLTPQGLDALIPQPNPDQSQNSATDIRTVVVQLACANFACTATAVKINRTQSSWETLEKQLLDIYKNRAEKVGFVKGEENVTWAHVARAIDTFRAAGVDKVGLMTKKIEEGE